MLCTQLPTPLEGFASKVEQALSLPTPPQDSNAIEPHDSYGSPTASVSTRRKTKGNPAGLKFGKTPFPSWGGPRPELCEEVYKILAEAHGEAKAPLTAPAPSLTVAGCGEVPSVLDALLRTLLSAATTMKAANAAFAALVLKYGVLETGIGAGSVDWARVRLSPQEELASTIKMAGLANGKAADMKKILDMVWEEHGQLSLEHLHGKTAAEAMYELVKYPRIGVKTAACVILFCLRLPCFAVDTHVHRFCKWLGWVPPTASPELTFWHCEYLVPDHLKYGLHQLFIRHGQTCDRCRANAENRTKVGDPSTCVVDHLLQRVGPRAKEDVIS
ncbi:unnamed protein product [Parascedosporium putredinis]|uniref:HhH-GPD domain-containing protein n=1 Tax=Parascedosporium putredinis TaxID=1442378 RepID=A0A9P1M890_9PEZI|nr:unnamed protein product [Parascedosporium putredinis]CAI7988466.1 unnamed protein product [Parascedosporium putredinis]